jgi:hypothetical protein
MAQVVGLLRGKVQGGALVMVKQAEVCGLKAARPSPSVLIAKFVSLCGERVTNFAI